MTEREYVERIKTSAQEYLAFIRGDFVGEQARNAIARWDQIKVHLSPHQAILLCEAWLTAAKDGDG
jgi:hypothetical protein